MLITIAGGRLLAGPDRPAGRLSLARDHDFRRLDDGEGVVAATELELANGVAGDDGGQQLIADAQANLSQQTVDSDFFDEPTQLIPSAQRDDRTSQSKSRISFRIVLGPELRPTVG